MFRAPDFEPELQAAIATCGVNPATVELGLDRQKVKQMLAQVRAIANPRYELRLSMAEPITRKVWVGWCNVEGVNSGLPFYGAEDIRKLVRACIWFARGGTQAQLEEIIIREEEESAYTNAA